VAKTNPFIASYPFAELLVGAGLLLVYFIEELIAVVFGIDHHDHQGKGEETTSVPSPMAKSSRLRETISTPVLNASTKGNGLMAPELPVVNTVYESMANRNLKPVMVPSGGDAESPLESATSLGTSFTSSSDLNLKGSDIVEEEKDRAVIGAATLVMAMLIHTALEGFAFGIQTRSTSITSLFFGIAVHKALVFFAVGLSLTQALPHKRWVVVICITLLASFTPLGGMVGILVEVRFAGGSCNNGNDRAIFQTSEPSPAKAIASSVLTAISIGTFLYIAIFEILAHERHKNLPKLLQWAGCALGYTIMAGALLFTNEP
jgi:zinc transporter 1/2/3